MRPLCRKRIVACALSAGFALGATADTLAQAWVPGEGHGNFSVSAQHLFVKHHTTYRGDKLDAGTITSNSLLLGLDYGVTERLAVSVAIPYISKKYVGASPHDPSPFNDGHNHDDQEHPLLDDGDYHSNWQDWALGLRWQWRSEPWAITPYLAYNRPSNDYPFFAHAAVGLNMRSLEAGVSVARRFEPPWQDWYFHGRYGYTRTEEVAGLHPDFSSLHLEAGHYFNERWSGRVVLIRHQAHNGLEFPVDYAGLPADDPRRLHHDKLNASRLVDLAVGTGYQINDRYSLYGLASRTIWSENTHATDYAITLGVSRSF